MSWLRPARALARSSLRPRALFAAAPRRRRRRASGLGAARASAWPAADQAHRHILGGPAASALFSTGSSDPQDFVKDIPSFKGFLEEDRARRAGDTVRVALSEFDAEADQDAQLTDLCGRQHSYLRLSLTEKCNLRCLYCMPEEGIPLRPRQEMLTTDELVEIARHFNAYGVDKIRLTGGEPLVNRDVGIVCRELGALPGMKTLAITTNGIKLPRKLPSLLDSGVNLFNISLDTLIPSKFEYVTRRRGFDRVMGGIDMLCEAWEDGKRAAATTGRVSSSDSAVTEAMSNYHGSGTLGTLRMPKVNVVVTRGFNVDEVCDFVELTRDRPIDVRFIEFMPFDANSWDHDKFVSYAEMLELINAHPNLGGAPGSAGLVKLPDEPSSTTKSYKLDGFAGQVGFITSMTEPFCGGCNRLRVTADGDLKVCLFGDEADGTSLRDVMRSSAYLSDPHTTLSAVIAKAVRAKHPMLGGHTDMHHIAERSTFNRSMTRIGG